MFQAKYFLQLLRHSPKYYGTKSTSGNAYYSDKKKIAIVIDPLKDDLKKVKECIPVAETLNKSIDDIESIAYQNEQDILRTVMTEKEKDASVRSRLSKECNELFRNRKVTLCTTGLNLHFDPIELQRPKRDDCRSKPQAPAVKSPAKPPQQKPPNKGDSGGGTSASANRPVRGEPGKVLFAFLPVEWPAFFMPITGVSGFWTLLVTCGTFLVSKEYYVLEHNYYGGLSMMIVVWGAITYVGPSFAVAFDRQVDDYERQCKRGRADLIKSLNEGIDDEHLLQLQADGHLMLMAAKRENVALQLEEAFRKRQMQVYDAVVGRLNYHLMVGAVYKRIHHKNLIEYVTAQVQKSITPDMQDKMLNISIDNILSELEKGDKK